MKAPAEAVKLWTVAARASDGTPGSSSPCRCALAAIADVHLDASQQPGLLYIRGAAKAAIEQTRARGWKVVDRAGQLEEARLQVDELRMKLEQSEAEKDDL